MTKRERVIKGLECCKIPFTKCYNGGCPYFENEGCKARLKGDALALLKAQEPVEPKKRDVNYGNLKSWAWICGVCGADVIWGRRYCPDCGQAVKWE